VHLWFKMFVHGLILQVILSMMKLETSMKCSLNHIPYTHCEDEFLLPYLPRHPQIQSENHASNKEKTAGGQIATHSRRIGLNK